MLFEKEIDRTDDAVEVLEGTIKLQLHDILKTLSSDFGVIEIEKPSTIQEKIAFLSNELEPVDNSSITQTQIYQKILNNNNYIYHLSGILAKLHNFTNETVEKVQKITTEDFILEE
mmetsp:Transcript_37680/g.33691  ORF Transcript_37680/g.33691 Transcript_37680/m.33691 type:complete len:116 (-) Transcript_37680:86-433(-)